MTPTRIIGALSLALLMTAGVASAQVTSYVPSAASTVNTAGSGATHISADISANTFTPHNIVVVPGSTVTWTNRDSVTHSIVADKGGFTSGPIPAGGSYSQFFNEPGSYLYYDPTYGGAGGQGMFGIVVVLPYGSSNTSGTSCVGAGCNTTTTTSTASASNSTSGTPNVPNTGAGGTASANMTVLALSGLIAFASIRRLRTSLGFVK